MLLTKRRLQPREKSMNIVHVVSSLKVGGMEHFVLRLACAQQNEGHRVSVMALQDGPLRTEATKISLPFVVLGGTSKIKRVLRALWTFKRLRPDIVNAHNETSLHYAALARHAGSPQIVLTNHGQGAGKRHNPDRKEWRHIAAIVAVSDAVAGRMDDAKIKGKVCTIVNGVSLSPAQKTRLAVRDVLGLSVEAVVGIMVARIDNLKGHDTLLRAAALLKKRGTCPTLLIVGDGAERQNRERLACELGLQSVRFLGFRDDVPDLLRASDFFVLPSLTEGLPLSILEAMSHGLPTVASDVGGIPELITPYQHGLLVPSEQPELLARAMETVAGDYALRQTWGSAAKRRVTEEFSFQQMANRYEDLYTGLLLKNSQTTKSNKSKTLL